MSSIIHLIALKNLWVYQGRSDPSLEVGQYDTDRNHMSLFSLRVVRVPRPDGTQRSSSFCFQLHGYDPAQRISKPTNLYTWNGPWPSERFHGPRGITCVRVASSKSQPFWPFGRVCFRAAMVLAYVFSVNNLASSITYCLDCKGEKTVSVKKKRKKKKSLFFY